MATIKTTYNSGGSDQIPAQGNANALATVLRELVDDNLRANAIASADATDLATAITLVNEIKAALNTALTVTKG